jgi:outer membrane protein assembly factor BamB
MEPIQQKPLRLLPGVIIVVIQWLLWLAIPSFVHGDTVTQIGVFGGLLGGLAIVVWWAFFSRAPRFDRWSAVVLMIGSLLITKLFLDKSIATSMMGLMFTVYSIPVLSLAFIFWAVGSRNLSTWKRRATMAATILLASGIWAFLRTDGMDAESHQDIVWRWAKSSEERMLAHVDDKLKSLPADSVALSKEPEWPGFRGINRDDIVHGTKIGSDWTKSPPVEMWRRPVGPGCSSFAIHGSLLFTQEQRGEYEMVTCYDINTGELVWKHGDKARFWDSHAGAGPRSTPTLYNGRVYTLGGTGILNVLDERTGLVIWSRNAASDNDVKVLTWGFTGSPLVVNDIVAVSLSGKLAGYDAASGKLKWAGTDGLNGYSSPHLVSIDSVPQIILMSQSGAISVDPVDGKQLWQYPWPVMDRILQPALVEGGDLLFEGEAKGISRVKVSHTKGEWTAKELWKSAVMKQNFNDFIIHKGFAYGYDSPAIACLDLKDGALRWRGAPYRGFSILLADQDQLLILTEKGDLALTEATPGRFRELARIKALKDRTWNHPALAGNIVVVRNNKEMVAYRLPAEKL